MEEKTGVVDRAAESSSDKQYKLDGTDHDERYPQYSIDENAPEGAQRIEAITIVWSKWSLIFAYCGVFIALLYIGLLQYAISSLSIYTVSAFSAHSLVSTTTMLDFLIAGVVQLPIGKLIDVWGRLEGLLLMIGFMEIGFIMLALCKNVETYAAGNILFEVGFSGIVYVLTVFIADTSTVKNRSLMLGLSYTPYIFTTFAGSPLAQAFVDHSTWRWGYGTFAIALPFICLPVVMVLCINQRKSTAAGVIKAAPSGRTTWQSIVHYCIEFDAIGIILFGAGLTIFLLPFTLAASSYKSWASASEITMFVLGFVLLIVFFIYESFFSPACFIPYKLLNDRTVLGACLLNFVWCMSYFIWDTYYSSYLQVVHGLSITYAGYVVNIYWNGVGVAGVFSGWIIRRTGNFKMVAALGVALLTLGTGLLIHFRQPGTHVGYLVMCQLFIAMAAGMLTIAQFMALLSPANATVPGEAKPSVALLMSLSSLSQKTGAAIGLCIAGGIWTNQFVDALRDRLPEALKSQADSIYGSVVVQLAAVPGSPTKIAIDGAYGDMQRKLTITATSVLVLCFVAVAMWRNVKVSSATETKGLIV